MAITFYNIDDKVVSYHDLQDKSRWCKDGESLEHSFVRRFPEFMFEINPDKLHNPYAPDLIYLPSNSLADLKSQHAPFFKAGVLYGLDPTYAVVFNVKDKERYESIYPDIDIVYYVEWIPIRADMYGREYKVQPHTGVYKTSFANLMELLKKSPVHSYQQRVRDKKGNAKDSYVIDIRNPIFTRLI